MEMKVEMLGLEMPVKRPMIPVGKPDMTFDEIIETVSEGDTLLCIDGVTGDRFFTTGKEYQVVESELSSQVGQLTIKDNEGGYVPRIAFGRIELNDTFVKVEKPIIKTPWPETSAPTFSQMDTVARLDLLKAWKAGENIELQDMGGDWHRVSNPVFDNLCAYRIGKTDEGYKIEELESEAKDLVETINSFTKTLRENNQFIGSVSPTWGDMSRNEKAALLLAYHDGKPIQFHDPWNSGDFWITLDNKAPVWNTDVSYRVEPDSISSLKAEIRDLNTSLIAVEDELSELRDEDEWEW